MAVETPLPRQDFTQPRFLEEGLSNPTSHNRQDRYHWGNIQHRKWALPAFYITLGLLTAVSLIASDALPKRTLPGHQPILPANSDYGLIDKDGNNLPKLAPSPLINNQQGYLPYRSIVPTK